MPQPLQPSDSRERIVSLLYDGVLSPLDWYAAMDSVRLSLGAGVFHFFTYCLASSAASGSVDNQDSFGVHATKFREFVDHHVDEDLRIRALMTMPLGDIMLDHEHISPQEMSRNVVYADLLLPLGFKHTMGAMLRDDNGTRDYMGFIRPSDHKVYDADDQRFIQHLMPDLIRAARLRTHMMQLSRQASLGIAALEALAQGIAVVDAQCRIHYANPAAERLMTQPSAMSTAYQRLKCTNDALNERLLQQVAQACANPGKAGAFDSVASTSTAKTTRLVVTVLPLKSSHLLASSWQMPMALVILTVPGSVGGLDHRLVSDMLGLSPSEARLLLLLASGKRVKDFAALEACSWHTARTHMKNLMRKTGCHSQIELVQLVQSLQVG